jgi:hypothetical protein
VRRKFVVANTIYPDILDLVILKLYEALLSTRTKQKKAADNLLSSPSKSMSYETVEGWMGFASS